MLWACIKMFYNSGASLPGFVVVSVNDSECLCQPCVVMCRFINGENMVHLQVETG